MKVKFANGNIYDVADVDEAISKCLSDGNDPFNPEVLTEDTPQETIKEEKDANRE